MKKIIRQYEEKNKIIEEIEKNLRMTNSKSPRLQSLNKKKLTNDTFGIDLPTISVKHQYTPKSQNNSLQKRYSLQYSRQQMQQKTKKPHNKPWVQTISFQCQQKKQLSPLVLINKRTAKNYLLSARTIQSGTCTQKLKLHEMLMSSNKFIFTHRDRKFRQSQYLKNVKKKQIQKSTFFKVQKNEQDLKIQTINSEHSQKVIQEMMSTQMNKKQNQIKTGQRRSDQLKSANKRAYLAPSKIIRRGKKQFNMNKKSYSPWNSQDNQQLIQFWDPSS